MLSTCSVHHRTRLTNGCCDLHAPYLFSLRLASFICHAVITYDAGVLFGGISGKIIGLSDGGILLAALEH